MPGDPIRPLTIALCQFAPRKGDTAGNLARVGRLCAQAATLEPRPQVVHFPETALSGYFVEGGVREVAPSPMTSTRPTGLPAPRRGWSRCRSMS
jgi:predicted amidohydrolase